MEFSDFLTQAGGRGAWGGPAENGPCSQAGLCPNYQIRRHGALGVAIVTADETHPFGLWRVWSPFMKPDGF